MEFLGCQRFGLRFTVPLLKHWFGIWIWGRCGANLRFRGSAFALGLTAALTTNPPFVVTLVFLTSLIGGCIDRFILGVSASALGLPAGPRRIFSVARPMPGWRSASDIEHGLGPFRHTCQLGVGRAHIDHSGPRNVIRDGEGARSGND